MGLTRWSDKECLSATGQATCAVPVNYRADDPHRLLIAFHGRTNTNEQVRHYYRLETPAQAGPAFTRFFAEFTP